MFPLKILFAFFVSLILSQQEAQALGSKNLAKSLDSILSNSSRHTVQSIHVVRVSDGLSLYEKGADVLATPASVTKLVTSAAMLTKFGSARTFKTRLYYTGTLDKGVISGNLIVVGDGDPLVISEKLWQLAADLRHMGVVDVKGDLIIDNSLFDSQTRDPSRLDGKRRSNNAYDAPVTAFGINFNTFAVAISPNTKLGKPAIVRIDPYPIKGVVITNKTHTSSTSMGSQIKISRVSKKGGEHLVATGSVPLGSSLRKIYRSTSNPVLVAGEYLRSFLKGARIRLRGVVKQGNLPKRARPLITLEGYKIRRIVAGLNTFSNNYIADVLTKRLGAEFPKTGSKGKGQGTFENGVHALVKFLKDDVGLRSKFTLNDGSGLSIENRLSSRQLTKLLSYTAKNMTIFPDYIASLPATGLDGTLKKRFAKGNTIKLKGLLRAKTGTLSQPVSVVALAGFFHHPSHGLIAFAILENGTRKKEQPSITALRDRQDKFLTSLMKQL